MATIYEDDEFDALAAKREASGAHRVIRKSHAWLIALIAVLVLAPLTGFGVGVLVANVRIGLPDKESASTAELEKPAADDSGDAAAADEDGATSESAAQAGTPAGADTQYGAAAPGAASAQNGANAAPDTAAEIKYGANVQVLNGARIRGFARQHANMLKAKGFTSLTAADYHSSDPRASTVYYADATMKSTATAIAAELGISNIAEDSTTVPDSNSVIVVLRSDLSE